MGVYLEDHPPARRQYYNPRRRPPGGRAPTVASGAIVVHTAENATDTVLPDAGAEGVAAFISRRSDPGSYHTVVDSDSIVRVGRYEWEMFHEGTGGNRWSLGLAFACRAAQWPTLPASWWGPAIGRAAVAAADMADWVEATTGVTVPAHRITPAEYRAGKPGFVGHGELDPGRRSDPGVAFPWVAFLDTYRLAKEPIMAEAAHPGLVGFAALRNDIHALTDLYIPLGDPTDLQEALERDRTIMASGRSWGIDIAPKLAKGQTTARDVLAFIQWYAADPAEADAWIAAEAARGR